MSARPARKAPRLAPEDRITAILASARIALAENGHENFLPSDVASRCGVSEATIYRYFPTKRDLLAKVAEEWFGEILSVEPEITRRADACERLRLLVRHSLGVVRQEPQLTRFVLTELRADPGYRSSQVYALNRRFTSWVVNLVKDGAARGDFRAGVSPALVRDLIFGGIEHRTWSFLRGQGDFAVDEVADEIADLIFNGLAPRARLEAGMALSAVEELRNQARAMEEAADRLERSLSPARRGPAQM